MKRGGSGIHYALGRELLVMDDLKGAAKAFRDALQVDPEDVECRYHLAFTLCRSGDHNGEVRALREAIRLEPRREHGKTGSSRRASQSRKRAQSFMAYSTFRISCRITNLAIELLASALAETGDLDGAMAEYREAIRKNEKGHARNKSSYEDTPLLSVLIERDPAKLIPELREAIRINPDLAATPVGFHLALALARSGDLEGAVNLFENVCRNADIRLWSGQSRCATKKRN